MPGAPGEGSVERGRLVMCLRVLTWAFALAYPAVVYVSLSRGQPWLAWVCLGVLVGLRLLAGARGARRETLRAVVPQLLAVVLLGAGLKLTGDPRVLFALPVLVNGLMLVIFARTLGGAGPPMLERFARLVEPDLDAPKRAHLRQFTWVWCAFFALNAAASAWLAVRGEARAWALYTGGVAYGLMGGLFAAEVAVRVRRFGLGSAGLPGRWLSRIFAPGP